MELWDSWVEVQFIENHLSLGFRRMAAYKQEETMELNEKQLTVGTALRSLEKAISHDGPSLVEILTDSELIWVAESQIHQIFDTSEQRSWKH